MATPSDEPTSDHPHGGTPTQHRYRYQALATWAAIIASFAAVGGLVFTAFSVRYQAEQTGLQVKASNAQVDQQNKEQADLVNLWAASEFSSQGILVTVSNRSQEPVYQFRLYIALASGKTGFLAISTWSSFPPCTDVTFDLTTIADFYAQTARLMGPSDHFPKFDYGIIFKDATGQAWHRHASGTLHPTPWLEYLRERGLYNPVLPPVFRSFTPLLTAQFTTPVAGQIFVTDGPTTANGCD